MMKHGGMPSSAIWFYKSGFIGELNKRIQARCAVVDKHSALFACIFGDIGPTAKVIGKIIGKAAKIPNVVGDYDSLTFLVNVENVNSCP